MENLQLQLEGILRNSLNCRYLEFCTKSDVLWNINWRSSIAFALGYKLALEDNPQRREEIDYFLGNMKGECMRDLVENYSCHCFKSEEEAYAYIRDIIQRLRGFLLSNQPLNEPE